MACCQTDCIEKPLSRFFGKFGRFVGTYPVWFLVVPLFLSAGLGGGFYFLKDREANDIEEQFTPVNGPAKQERNFVKDNFPQNDAMFSSQRLYTEGTYASLIAVLKSNVLSEAELQTAAFEEITNLDRKVINIPVHVGKERFMFKDIGAKFSYKMNFPGLNLSSEFGGIFRNDSVLAIRLFYYIQRDNGTKADLWLDEFIKFFSNRSMINDIEVSYFTSRSRQEEFEKNAEEVIPFFAVTYVIAISFSIVSCMRLDCVRNKVWVATFGVLSAGLAVLSSFGMMLYIGVPFVMTVANSPFLILGIGVDDMFILISCWQQTNIHHKVEDRLADTYKEAAISITITTLTDVLAFYIGLMTPFRSVQSFCLYTSTAILFCYIYSITFFGAILVLNGRREDSNRHWMTCMKVPEEQPPGRSKAYHLCCVGGAFDRQTGTEEVQPMSVTGFMALWDVNLDTISMIILVVCIGFSVDFSAHISYAFVSNKKAGTNEKAVEALFTLGYPIVQGAVSTILGVVVLSVAQSYIFRTFFKILFLVILIGLFHGITFIPVFLTLFDACGRMTPWESYVCIFEPWLYHYHLWPELC
ncbi:hypothetical protein AGOR_G00142890 [Albula goreensis]|uniref:SSD domain-containing protein n=1 Tax=Albula goreensis TaxID=1534307 RepID=A0A8T3D135_9TELE|nr:hypothetical protein AGOR_G00142890 [Albula goreensis]